MELQMISLKTFHVITLRVIILSVITIMMDKMCGTPDDMLKNISCYNASCNNFDIASR